MAWWNQPEGAVTPTVTLKRLVGRLAEHGHGYDIDLPEGLVRSSMAGHDYILMVVDRRILVIRAHHRLGTVPGPAVLSRVRAVAQDVSSARLIPALYTEVDDAGLNLCAEVLTNVGAGLDDAQLAGTIDFVLDGIDEALREVLGRIRSILSDRAEDRAEDRADSRPDARPAPRAAGVRARTHAESDVSVKSDERMVALGDADGGTGVETTNTPERLLMPEGA